MAVQKILAISGLIIASILSFALAKNVLDEERDKNKKEDILPHYVENQHLDTFDQTLFLGGQAKAKAFRSMSEAERKKVFTNVFHKVDTSGDGLVNKAELAEWLFEALLTVDKEDATNSMDPIDADNDKMVSWFEYHDHVYGYLPGDGEEADQEEYKKYIKRSKRTFDLADRDEDGYLNADEFHMFHNPRFYKEMEKIVIQESLEDFDTNGDGGIEIEEFLGDIVSKEDDDDLPEWIHEEKHMFKTELDHDGNGKLEGSEIFDLESQEKSLREQAEREVDHLIAMADQDADDHLSLDEALHSESLFMGQGQQTHFHKNPQIVVQHNEL